MSAQSQSTQFRKGNWIFCSSKRETINQFERAHSLTEWLQRSRVQDWVTDFKNEWVLLPHQPLQLPLPPLDSVGGTPPQPVDPSPPYMGHHTHSHTHTHRHTKQLLHSECNTIKNILQNMAVCRKIDTPYLAKEINIPRANTGILE